MSNKRSNFFLLGTALFKYILRDTADNMTVALTNNKISE